LYENPIFQSTQPGKKDLIIDEEKQKRIVNPAAVIADVGAPNRLDFILTWFTNPSEEEPQRFGFFHLPGDNSMKQTPSQCALKVMVHYNHNIVHDFSTRKRLKVPVHIYVRNRLQETASASAVHFLFETLEPEDTFEHSKKSFKTVHHSSVRSRYLWEGATKLRIRDFASGSVHIIKLTALFYQPGHYNLNRFKFTVDIPGEGAPRVFFFPLQHLTNITDVKDTNTSVDRQRQIEEEDYQELEAEQAEEDLGQDPEVSLGATESTSVTAAVEAG